MQPPYRVLGPCQALRTDDGTEAVLGGARLRALLTALAAAGGRAVGTRASWARFLVPGLRCRGVPRDVGDGADLDQQV
ncbi:hypothetical protein, partial [Streptomyces sp. NPDC039028]|uniref:hypothetical protein n=1 Tax=Streptomyces sp. NPDC039028 TaxID=3155370 RepID=UPI003402664D